MTHSVPLLTYLLAVNSALGADLLVGPAQPYVTIEDAARAAASGDRILVDPGTYYEDQVALNADSLEILAVGGQGTVTVYLNPGENNFFELKNNSVLTLSDLVFDGQGEGRLVDMRRSTLYVKRSLVSRTLSPNGGKGGTILADFSTVDVANSDLAGELSANGNGGVIHLVDSTLSMSYSTVRQGITALEGGGISGVQGSTATVEYSSLLGNIAASGSAADMTGGDLVIRSTLVQGNATTTGTIRCADSLLCDLEQVYFQDNVAQSGAMLVSDNNVATQIIGSSLCGATGASAVELIDTAATIERSVFYDNALDGPLVSVDALTNADIVNNHFVGMSSSTEGAVAQVEGPTRFVNNLVSHNAGAGPVVAVPSLGYGTYPPLTSGTSTSTGQSTGTTSTTGTTGTGTTTGTTGSTGTGTTTGTVQTVTVISPLTTGYNLFFDNTQANSNNPLLYTNLVGVDPQISPVSPSYCDLSVLLPPGTSPVVDAGDPTLFDDDGTVADIGAFGNLVAPPTTPGGTGGTGLVTGTTGTTGTWTDPFADNDNDGVPVSQDCDDNDAEMFPGNLEVLCDEKDNDCDPLTLDYIDNDGDGVSQCDNDCNDDDPNYWVEVEVYRDKDLDGFGKIQEPSYLCGLPWEASHISGDCDDQDATVNPDAEEIPYDGIDQDCDGADIFDIDGDGSPGPEDCDDNNPNRYPGAEDIPLDGRDQDCTGFDAGTVLIGGSGFNCGGCDSGRAPSSGGWLALLALLGLRRRR